MRYDGGGEYNKRVRITSTLRLLLLLLGDKNVFVTHLSSLELYPDGVFCYFITNETPSYPYIVNLNDNALWNKSDSGGC